MRITGYFLILLGIFITACGDDDVVFTPDEAIYFVSPDTTSITRTVNDVIEVDAYFSLDSVIDSVFVGYQIDTTGMPPMNLSLNDLDEITERIGFPLHGISINFSFHYLYRQVGVQILSFPEMLFVLFLPCNLETLIVTKTLRVDITL